MDEVAIWNDALTAAEVTALYNSGSGLRASSNSGNYASSANLKGYWKFDEGSGTTLTDQTSNDNDGTISGSTYALNNWTQLGSDINGEASDDFSGWSVSLDADGDRMAIGARYDEGNDARAGRT